MKRLLFPAPALLVWGLGGNAALAGQEDPTPLEARVEAAQAAGATLTDLLDGANAARLLRDFEAAGPLYEASWVEIRELLDRWIADVLLFEMASGAGVDGLQRRFREVRQAVRLTPQMIVGHVSSYPSLLAGGEFDEMVLSLSREHPDPGLRCSCYHAKAWVHRVAGRAELSRIYFDSLTSVQEESSPPGNPDAAAEWRAQLARDLARAGRTEDARQMLERAMRMPVSDAWMPRVRRRWAQAYAELGDAASAVEHLEALLSVPSLVTVHTLETRWTWEPIRDAPEFRTLLDRHGRRGAGG